MTVIDPAPADAADPQVALPSPHPAPGGLDLADIGGLLCGSHGRGDQWAGRHEFYDVLAALRAEGAAVPAGTQRALTLHVQLDRLVAPGALGDAAAVVAASDLQQLTAWQLSQVVRDLDADRARAGLTSSAHAAIDDVLLTRAIDALAAAVPEVLAPLVEPFRAALGDVERAVAAGITADSTPADVIDDDEAVQAWRRLVAPDGGVGRLNRLWTLRCRVIRVVGCHVPPAPRAVPQVDPLAERLAAIAGNAYDDSPDTAPVGVPDGFARHGRTAWLRAVASDHDVVAEFAHPVLIAARRHERDPRGTAPADAPTLDELEAAPYADVAGGRHTIDDLGGVQQ